MSNIICKKTFNLGKIAFYGKSAINPVTIDLELRKCGGEPTFTIENGEKIPTGKCTPEYFELSICGCVWNSRKTNIVCAGQCLEEINKHLSKMSVRNIQLFKKLLSLWRQYHLNGMNAGTPVQEAFLAGLKAMGWKYDYADACEMLKAANLYEVHYTGISVGHRMENEPYKYGHGWIVQELPESVVQEVMELCKEAA